MFGFLDTISIATGVPLLGFIIGVVFGTNCVIGITENGAKSCSMRLCGDGKLTVVRHRVGNLTLDMWHNETRCMRLSAVVSALGLDEVPSKGAGISDQYGAGHT